MTTVTWSAPVNQFQSLCVNDLRVETIPNEVRLDNCNVCVAPQVMLPEPDIGCHICRSLPFHVNIILDQPLGQMTGAPTVEECEFTQKWKGDGIWDSEELTIRTRWKKEYIIFPPPQNRVFRLRKEAVLPDSIVQPWDRATACRRVWAAGNLYYERAVPASGMPRKNIPYTRPDANWFRYLARNFPVGPPAVAGIVESATVPFSDIYGFNYRGWRNPPGVTDPFGYHIPEFADVIDATPGGREVRQEIVGYAWSLAVGEPVVPVPPNYRNWRPTYTVAVYLTMKIAMRVSSVVTGAWPWAKYYPLQQNRIDWLFPPTNNEIFPWRGPIPQYQPTYNWSQLVQGATFNPSVETFLHHGPAWTITPQAEVRNPPFIESASGLGAGHPTSGAGVLDKNPALWGPGTPLDWSVIPSTLRLRSPWTGIGSPMSVSLANNYLGTGDWPVQSQQIGVWLGRIGCNDPMPAPLYGGEMWPKRLFGPAFLPPQIFVDIGQLP